MNALTGGLTIKKAKPTQRHRLAIVSGILGTVYAVNAEGVCKYFDYDFRGARAWAGLDQARDIRLARPPRKGERHISKGATEANPRNDERCIWVLR